MAAYSCLRVKAMESSLPLKLLTTVWVNNFTLIKTQPSHCSQCLGPPEPKPLSSPLRMITEVKCLVLVSLMSPSLHRASPSCFLNQACTSHDNLLPLPFRRIRGFSWYDGINEGLSRGQAGLSVCLWKIFLVLINMVKPSPLWAASFPGFGSWLYKGVEGERGGGHERVPLSLLLTVGRMWLTASSSCLDFLGMTDYNLELWAKTDPFFPKFHFAKAFCHSNKEEACFIHCRNPLLSEEKWAAQVIRQWPVLAFADV